MSQIFARGIFFSCNAKLQISRRSLQVSGFSGTKLFSALPMPITISSNFSAWLKICASASRCPLWSGWKRPMKRARFDIVISSIGRFFARLQARVRLVMMNRHDTVYDTGGTQLGKRYFADGDRTAMAGSSDSGARCRNSLGSSSEKNENRAFYASGKYCSNIELRALSEVHCPTKRR